MKRITIAILILSVFLFSACDGDVIVNLYVQDLIELKSGNVPKLYTTANIVVTNITKDSEKEYLRSVIGNVTNERMVSRGYSEAYSFDTKIPILGKGASISEVADNDLIYIQMIETPEGMVLAYKYNEIVLSKIRQWIKSEYYQEFSTEDITMSIKIDNDSREDFSFTTRSVYINDKAYPFESKNILSRRDNLSIQISEVLKNAIETNSDFIPFIKFE
ncbi:MAG: hypothetical protein CVV47_13555 [Spirochaetae bacterium HGW-Spirochaetae-3]|jgi:hypothetical protein|nr:MAG: hypothetical protein CVV47_13555 [Spirochaetae bacterium HGW-Spirochaetae-3]